MRSFREAFRRPDPSVRSLPKALALLAAIAALACWITPSRIDAQATQDKATKGAEKLKSIFERAKRVKDAATKPLNDSTATAAPSRTTAPASTKPAPAPSASSTPGSPPDGDLLFAWSS